MNTKKIFMMIMMIMPIALYAYHNCNDVPENIVNNECICDAFIVNNSNTKKCPNCGGNMKQFSKVVNKRDYSRNCPGCNGHGRQGRYVNGKIVYDGPSCKACDGTGHPNKQVVVYYWKCSECNLVLN